jgi:hypothetical protein
MMSSLACPECRKEMLPQKDYDQLVCGHCGKKFYEPGEKLRKIYCTDCNETGSDNKIRIIKY